MSHAICSNMDGPRDYHKKWNKPERERQISYNLYVASKKNDTNELIYKARSRLTDLREGTYGFGGEGGKQGQIGNLGLSHIHYHI